MGEDEARKNKNRGYQQLRVWQDAIQFYALNCRVFKTFPYELRRVASQAIASSDSVHRNIAEGYCRRSIREYLNYLNIALYREAKQLREEDFESLNQLAYRLENGLLKLVESLERKQMTGDWVDHLVVKESNAVYENS
jgi:four helix bundle protein